MLYDTMENRIILQSGRKGMTSYGHPWIYKSQIKSAEGAEGLGKVYSVYSSGGRFLGRGYYNPKSEITVRLLTYKEEDIDRKFFEKRLEAALRFRKRFIEDTDAYRVVFSESDGLPGLIVDNYGTCVVFQILTLGMEVQKELLAGVIKDLLEPKFLYEKSDSPSRKLEGLEIIKAWRTPPPKGEIEICEDGSRFLVDVEEGHKTGFYLDQRSSRRAVKEFAKDKRVLDCFSYTGGFSISSALAGAKEVLGIDIHEGQIRLAGRNAKLNGLADERVKFRAENVFEALKRFDKSREKFDVVILDPPSFVKNKKALEGALAGYKEINLRAMRILKEGGILATFSCSSHMEEELFLQVVLDAAFDTKRELRILKRCGQSLDHPVDPFIPQTSYLKGFILEVR